MSYDFPNEAVLTCRRTDSSTLMDLHFETYLYLQANNDMYMWNQVNCTKNHYGKVGASSPYKQWSYPKVSCPHQDRFTSPFVCKLYVDADGVKVIPRIGYIFLCKQYICKSSKTPFNMGSSGIPDSRSPIFHYNCLNPISVRELPLPAPQLLSKQEK